MGQFLVDLADTRRFSPHTVAAYRRDLQQFIDSQAMASVAPSERTLTAQRFQRHLAGLAVRGLSNRSIARAAASLRSFLQFLHRRGVVRDDLSERVPSVKFAPNLPQFLSESQMMSWIRSLPDGDRWECRDRCLVVLPYATGARLAELVALNWGDIDGDGKTVRLFGKRSRERVVPAGQFLLESIASLRALTPGTNTRGKDPLFVNRRGARLTARSISRILQRTFRSAVGGHVTAHRLRQTFATHMLEHGADLMALKELLGHQNVATTQIYTHVTPHRLAEVYAGAFPTEQSSP